MADPLQTARTPKEPLQYNIFPISWCGYGQLQTRCTCLLWKNVAVLRTLLQRHRRLLLLGRCCLLRLLHSHLLPHLLLLPHHLSLLHLRLQLHRHLTLSLRYARAALHRLAHRLLRSLLHLLEHRLAPEWHTTLGLLHLLLLGLLELLRLHLVLLLLLQWALLP